MARKIAGKIGKNPRAIEIKKTRLTKEQLVSTLDNDDDEKHILSDEEKP
jgi:hypothetical protein